MNMAKFEGKILMAVILVVAIFIGCMVNMEAKSNQTIAVAFAAAPVDESVPLDSQLETEPEVEATLATEPVIEDVIPTQEEFMAGIYDNHTRELYEQLFEIYDYEEFMTRSDIPQYFQSVYHKSAFAGGTIKSSGCGISCLAMITSYLYGQTITPDMYTLDYRGDNPASVLERLVSEDYLNIRMDKYYGNDARTQFHIAMENGNPVIMLHREGSIFTEGGHFIVVTGMTEDGRYIVNDPNMYNLLRTTYADEYMHGFTWDQLKQGLVGTYVFDTKADFNGDPLRVPHR